MIEELLNVNATLANGKVVKVNTQPIALQVDYLVANHFSIFISKEAARWRLENLYYIMTKDGRKTLFKLNKAQRHFYENYLAVGYKKIAILKSRQLGMTSLISLYFLDQVIFRPNSEALQIAHTLKDATEIFNRKIIYAIKNLPPIINTILEISQAKASRQQFSYPDGSLSAIGVSNSARSGTFSVGVHISELGKLAKLYQGRAEEIVTGTLPAIPVGGQAIIESTAEGASGLFHDIFMDGWKIRDTVTPALSKAHFKCVFYSWVWDVDEIEAAAMDGIILVSEMEECEINWKEYQEENQLDDKQMNFYYLKWINANKDIDKLHQEFPTHPMEAFLSSGSPYFNSRKAANMLDRCDSNFTRHSFINGKFEKDERGDLYIYEESKAGKNYVIGGDVAEGLLNGDYSTAFVLGYDKQIKAMYRGHCEPDDYKLMVEALGKRYNTALLAIEFNKDGNWVNTALRNDNYPNLYVRTTVDDITKEVTKSYGWLTNKKNRDFMLGESKKHFNSTDMINCRHLLEEILTFVRDKRGKPQAATGSHDDCFVRDTMVLTNKGNVPIQNLKIGDLVMTRNGYKPITKTRQRIKKVITKLGITGTPDHPFITEKEEKSFLDLDTYDTLYTWNIQEQKIEKQLFTKIQNTIDIQTQTEGTSKFTFGHTLNGKNHLFLYTGKFGKIITDQFQKGFISIISIMTRWITELKTLLLQKQDNILVNTCLLQKDANSLQTTQKNNSIPCGQEEISGLKKTQKQSALRSLNQYMEKLRLQIVYAAIKNLLILVNWGLNIVDVHVLGSTEKRIVYNIQVADTPEYFVNGILVHNCVIAWAIGVAVLQGRTEKTELPKTFGIMDAVFAN